MDGRPNVVAPPLAAARELLGDKFDDSGATSAVHPYGSAEVSFPRGLRALVDVVQALGREYAHVLGPETMLRECDELLDPPRDVPRRDLPQGRRGPRGLRCRAPAARAAWSDPEGDQFRLALLRVEKKNKSLRLIWDCRPSNRYFREPPRLDMGWAARIHHNM